MIFLHTKSFIKMSKTEKKIKSALIPTHMLATENEFSYKKAVKSRVGELTRGKCFWRSIRFLSDCGFKALFDTQRFPYTKLQYELRKLPNAEK
jgi:hypothetical protein